jgi:hypothetical protein
MAQEMDEHVTEPIPPVPVPMLGYATPLGAAEVIEGARREGKKLVTPRKFTLPARCIKCNGDAYATSFQKKLYWSSPWLLLLILLNLIICLIVVLVVRKKAVITYHLCQTHHRQRVKLITAAWLLALGGVGLCIAGPVLADGYRNDAFAAGGLISGSLMLVAAVITGFSSRSLVAVHMTDRFVWYKGCGNEFLSQLPPSH